ncbi:MAG: invasion associated locus B family protein [Rhizobiaceae bacterium]
MTSRLTVKTRTAVLAASAVAFMAGGLASASAQQVPQGWFKVCSKQEDTDVCNVQNLLMADSGQLLTGVSLIEVKGKVNRKVFQVSVPSGRLVPPGIGMQVDGGKAQKINYAICFPDRCIAEVGLTDNMVTAFKRGGELTLTSVNFQNQPNPIKISLKGFTDAFDGPPLQQSDIDAKQKKLQEEIEKRREEFEKKLKAEQDKAKASE